MSDLTLQNFINDSTENSRSKGFHDVGDLLRKINSLVEGGSTLTIHGSGETVGISQDDWRKIYAAYRGNRLMLIVGELVEAHEEIRSGKPDIYYGPDGKPEGVAVETADALIRTADWVGEEELDIEEAYEAKAAYNKTRSKMHGKQF